MPPDATRAPLPCAPYPLARLALAPDPDPSATATLRALDAARAFGEALVRVRTVSEALQIRARLAAVVAEFIGLEDAALAHANALVPEEGMTHDA